MCSDLVRPDEKWIEDTKDSEYSSVRMFTSESYHRSFWSLLEHGVVLLDEQYKIIEVNPYFVELVGVQAINLIGTDIRNYISPEFVHKDTVVMDSLMAGLDSSYCHDESIIKQDRRHTVIPVRIIVTRVPSHLLEDFQHFIVQVYKKNTATHIGEQQYIRKIDQSWSDIIKGLFLQPWFAKFFIWFIFIIIVLVTLSGDLLPLIDRIFG